MKKTPIKHKNLSSDFENLRINLLKTESADFLWKQCMLGNLKIVADKKLEDDGETTFVSLDSNGESKKATVKIKKSVADAVHVCWRMSTLLHELYHALHYLSTEQDIFDDETHGEDWRLIVKRTTERGGMKECAKKLASPLPRCIYKRNCVWCPSKGKNVNKKCKVFTVPRRLKKSKFGGNCQFCFTDDKISMHLRRSASCQKEYQRIFGPQCESVAKNLTYKDARVMKRVGKKNGPPVCMFCPAPNDKLLKVHLKANCDCEQKYMDKYKCDTKKAFYEMLTKVGNRLRKQKQRAKQKHSL